MSRPSSLLWLVLLLTACRGGQSPRTQAGGDTLHFQYATLLSVVRYDGYTEVKVKNPWKPGTILHQYTLVPSDSTLFLRPSGSKRAEPGRTLHSSLPEGTLVRTPLRRSMVFTTVHCAMLLSLDTQESIAGVADLKYIKIPWIHEQVALGRIADVGEGMSPVIEKIIDVRPDAILLSPVENSGGYGRLEEIDIPLIECAEYMEPTPLARAEWLRFYGLIYGCQQRADSLFQVVADNYRSLRTFAHQQHATKTALVDKVTGSVWYVPGGRSTIGQMIADANGRYPWASDDHSGSVSLPFEAVLERGGEADVWFFRYSGDHDITYQELAREHHGYDQFRAFRQHQAYGCNVERSNFYEETPFRPDWLLSDLIRILHPDLPNLPPLRYYKPLTDSLY